MYKALLSHKIYNSQCYSVIPLSQGPLLHEAVESKIFSGSQRSTGASVPALRHITRRYCSPPPHFLVHCGKKHLIKLIEFFIINSSWTILLWHLKYLLLFYHSKLSNFMYLHHYSSRLNRYSFNKDITISIFNYSLICLKYTYCRPWSSIPLRRALVFRYFTNLSIIVLVQVFTTFVIHF